MIGKMPGISERFNYSEENSFNYNDQNSMVANGMGPFPLSKVSAITSNGIWLEHEDDGNYNQLQKFWSDLPAVARQKLMRIDKQTLFEHARKNMYCSRCNGLLLEGFFQIVMYGKSLQHDSPGGPYSVRTTNNQTDDGLCKTNGCQVDAQDPSVLPWGGLTTTKDGTLTLLDSYICSKSLKGLQNVFDSARARERERELLYPDACGGGGRGWATGYGRSHGTREACALHTARLSVDTLEDFWSALSRETQQSLLRMKEDDFVERLMYRFDRKRFCRDCRRNVIREFKELKELKRLRREPRCTSWFCASDSAFQYEVSHDTVRADWHQILLDSPGNFHHFEWAIGSGEGKFDILDFENVGLSGKVEVKGLNLRALNSCYITLRACKSDGRCDELSVKAQSVQGKQCIHCRLLVGDGCVAITEGGSIRDFFEHAEEAEEEEDDDCVDKDGNDIDGDCSRPQKHAKSPELAREFLFDAATVIFKEQVEKAFREGTARQNAHSIFVCLALKLLEERVHVACKEIITLEKQMKLLEEEETEKREEEERKVRRKMKEKGKKLRRKERLREKEKKENKCFADMSIAAVVSDISKDDSTGCVDEVNNAGTITDFAIETGEAPPASPLTADIHDDHLLIEYICLGMTNHSEGCPDGEFVHRRELNASFLNDRIVYSRRKQRARKDSQHDLSIKWSDRKKVALVSGNGTAITSYESRRHDGVFNSTRSGNGFSKQLRTNIAKANFRDGGPVSTDVCSNNRIGNGYDPNTCSCKYHKDIRSRPESHIVKVNDGTKFEAPADMSKSYYRPSRLPQVECVQETDEQPKSKIIARIPPGTKKVWEPLDSRKKYIQSKLNSDIAVSFTPKVEISGSGQPSTLSEASNSEEARYISVQTNFKHNDSGGGLTGSKIDSCTYGENTSHAMEKSQQKEKKMAVSEDDKPCSLTGSPYQTTESSMISLSNSNNCSSCPSEGDSNVYSSNAQSLESKSTSDSEVASQNSEERETACGHENGLSDCNKVVIDPSVENKQGSKIQGHDYEDPMFLGSCQAETAPYCDTRGVNIGLGSTQPRSMLPQYAVFQSPTNAYYQQNCVSWPAGLTSGVMHFPRSHHYLFPNTYIYDMDGTAQFIQYGTVQHMTPSFLNPTHIPYYHPVAQGVDANTHASGATHPSGLREMEHSVHNEIELKLHPAEPPTILDVAQNGKTDKEATRSHSFSLFHFGGPVAPSTETEVDSISLQEGTTQKPSLNMPAKSLAEDPIFNKKASFEEYNLFASSTKFTFF